MVISAGEAVAASAVLSVVDAKRLANHVATICGVGKTLLLGTDQAVLGELLRLGVDAYAFTSDRGADDAFSERRAFGSLIELPYTDEEFACIVVLNVFERLPGNGLDSALAELRRVAARYAFVTVNAGLNEDRSRAHWEALLFKAGFRKHPAYYRVNSYEELNNEGSLLFIPLEKIPLPALQSYPRDSLREERNPHMDMMREVGARSDANIIRYQWAAGYVRPGDRVLDVACGLGYGPYVLKHLSEARSVLGMSGSKHAIDYATKSFSAVQPAISFAAECIPQALANQADSSFDVIVSFNTLEHVEDPVAVLAEFTRLLSPGGRLIVSVRNDCSDEAGRGQNPIPLHVYDWQKLKAQLTAPLLLEHAFALTAPTCGVAGAAHTERSLRQVDESASIGPESEWLLMVAMKNPIVATAPYHESVYGYSEPPRHLMAFERDYRNPWLVRSLVEFPFRAKNARVLHLIAEQVLADPANSGWPDEAAALAVLGYQLQSQREDQAVDTLIARIDAYLALPDRSPHGLRWRISLSYLLALLHKNSGRLQRASELLTDLAKADCTPFSPTIGTKVVDAAYEGGMLRAAMGDIVGARELWKIGMQQAFALLHEPVEEFIGNTEFPQHFPGAVAVELLDSATRSIKALRWTGDQSHGEFVRLLEQSRQSWKWMINERIETIASDEAMVRARDEAIRSMEKMIVDRDSAISAQTALIQDRDVAVAEQMALLDDRAEAISNMEKMIVDRDSAILAQTALIQDRDVAVAEQMALLDDRAEAISNMEKMIVDRDSAILAQTVLIQDRDSAIQDQAVLIQNRGVTIVEQAALLVKQQELLARAARSIQALESLRDSMPVKILQKIGIVKVVRDSKD